MTQIKVIWDPETREKELEKLLALEGLSHIKEDVNAAYCFISLTNTPSDAKKIIGNRQSILTKDILDKIGIQAYDPEKAPFSPDRNLSAQPNEVYLTDSGKIVGARYFIGHNLLPSTGQGIELEKAKNFNRMAVVFMDKNIRVSRMQPHRVIYLAYDDFEQQAGDIKQAISMLKEFTPGIGMQDGVSVLLGFYENGIFVNLEEKVHREFPHLSYKYDGTKQIPLFSMKNPEIFYENKNL